MTPTTKYIFGIIVVAAVLVGLMYAGVIPDYLGIRKILSDRETPERPQTSNEVDLQLSDFEIFSLLEVIFGPQTYTEIEPYVDALHMKVYGRNDMDAQTFLEWVEGQYVLDGWQSQGRVPQYATGWVAYHEIWTRTTNARSVTVGEGASVTQAMGYDTVYLVAYGPATTYWQFWVAVTT